jgi:hypothetical protein
MAKVAPVSTAEKKPTKVKATKPTAKPKPALKKGKKWKSRRRLPQCQPVFRLGI